MLPTPETPDLPSTVYPPSEDSYLLLDTLSSSSEVSFIASRFPVGASAAPTVVEIGTGSGVVIAFLAAHAAAIFGRTDIAALAVDLNPDACRAAARTVDLACRSKVSDDDGDSSGAKPPAAATISGLDASTTVARATETSKRRTGRHGTYLGAFEGDLCSALRPGSVDVLVFNPPYVPTDEVPARPDERGNGHAGASRSITKADMDVTSNSRTTCIKYGSESPFERESRFLDIAVSGGIDGMEVTTRLLDQLDAVLSERGVAYVLLSVRNVPGRVAETLMARGWLVDTVGGTGKKGGIEKLVVLRIARPTETTRSDDPH